MRDGTFWLIVQRDLRLAARRRVDILLPPAFFIVAASLFPLGVGPEPHTLQSIAPGIVWVCALLATMLSLGTIYAGDHGDGSLEQWLLSGRPLSLLAAGKAAAHWLLSGLPLVLLAPLLGLMFGMPRPSIVVLTLGLLLGTPALSLVGGIGAALTLGLRNGGVLLLLLVLPLCTPLLIFGASAVAAVDTGISAQGHLSLLAALLLLSALAAPLATAAALRISVD